MGVDLAEALAATSPRGDEAMVLLGLSGSDANDGAIEATRRATGRMGIISLIGSYHGSTGLSQQASGFPSMNVGIYEPSDDFAHLPFPNDPPTAEAVLTEIDELLSTGNYGALLMETIAGDSGVHFPSDDFLPRVRKLLDRHEALLILDEVQCGMGRTGTI